MAGSVELIQRVQENIARVFLGHPRHVDLLLAALLAGGHVLLDDVPGVGKTTLLKALVASLGLGFPWAALALHQASQALALLHGHRYVRRRPIGSRQSASDRSRR